jgi:hypothetical protein
LSIWWKVLEVKLSEGAVERTLGMARSMLPPPNARRARASREFTEGRKALAEGLVTVIVMMNSSV